MTSCPTGNCPEGWTAEQCPPENMGCKCCQNLCGGPNRPSWCDTNMTSYCMSAQGQMDPLCSCFDSQFRLPGYVQYGIPICFYTPCTNTGAYHTLDMLADLEKKGFCPGFCGNINLLPPSAQNKIKIKQQAICGAMTPPSIIKKRIVYAGIGLLVLIIILIIIKM